MLTKRKKIIQNNLDKITTVIVSLDAATPETYALTRGGNFDLVIDDGLHSPDANIATLEFGLKILKVGGKKKTHILGTLWFMLIMESCRKKILGKLTDFYKSNPNEKIDQDEQHLI